MDSILLALTGATVLNIAIAIANLVYYRRVRRRCQAVVRAEQRLSSGPVTASLKQRYG